jgi:FlaA1/EpsC-like NDP-sugar epimerase
VRNLRNRYVLLADLFLIALAVAGAFALRFDWRFYQYRHEFVPYLIAALLVRPLVFHFFGLYQRLWRFASVAELVAMVLAVLASSVVLTGSVAVTLLVDRTAEFSRAVLPIDALLVLVLTGGLRMSVRILADRRVRGSGVPHSGRRVLIVGAGQAGVLVLRELQRNRQLGMLAVGFLDDDPAKLWKRIHGVMVLGDLRSLVTVARDHRVDEVLIAIPTAGGTVLRGLAESCLAAGLASKIMPGVFELLDGRVSVTRLRPIEISDLLRRAPISGQPNASEYVNGQVVLITGAGGSIGSELCRQVAAQGPSRLLLLGHGENSLFEAQVELRHAFPDLPLDVIIADLRDRARLMMSFHRFRPAVVFHAAAHKHVPLMEENPEEAISNNVFGTRNVVDAALSAGVKRLVMISTDKAVSPTNVMGASKRLAELIVHDAARRAGAAFVVVRFGNVLGSRGSVVPLFKRQIERGGPVMVTHPDMERFFMTIPEAVHLVLQAGGIGRGAELFVLDMGAPVRIVDLARDLISLSGFRPEEIPIVFTQLRPGEKLTESLWEEGATVDATACPGVLRVTEPQTGAAIEVGRMLESLDHIAAGGDRLSIEAELARWLPSFVPASATRWTSAPN